MSCDPSFLGTTNDAGDSRKKHRAVYPRRIVLPLAPRSGSRGDGHYQHEEDGQQRVQAKEETPW